MKFVLPVYSFRPYGSDDFPLEADDFPPGTGDFPLGVDDYFLGVDYFPLGVDDFPPGTGTPVSGSPETPASGCSPEPEVFS